MIAKTVLAETKKLFGYIAKEQGMLFVYFNERAKERGPCNAAVMNFVLLSIAVEKDTGTDIPYVTQEMVIATIKEYVGDIDALTAEWELHYATAQPFLVPFLDTEVFPRMTAMTAAHRVGALQDVFLMLRPFEK